MTDGPEAVLPSIYDVTGFADGSGRRRRPSPSPSWPPPAPGTSVPAVRGRPAGGVGVVPLRGLARPGGLGAARRSGTRWPATTAPPTGGSASTPTTATTCSPPSTVLGVPADRDAVAAEVARWKADELESAVVDAGGCAAALRTGDEWAAHPAGQATAGERPVVIGTRSPSPGGPGPTSAAPRVPRRSRGIRVLDLTRVIAGPVATRYLAGYGADVLRIDPPGFEEVPALLPESTAGKRCAALDLTDRGRPGPVRGARRPGARRGQRVPARRGRRASATTRRASGRSTRRSSPSPTMPTAGPGPGPAGAASTAWSR